MPGIRSDKLAGNSCKGNETGDGDGGGGLGGSEIQSYCRVLANIDRKGGGLYPGQIAYNNNERRWESDVCC